MAFNFFSGGPQDQAMLALASGLLESGGPSRTPVSLGQGAARGVMSGREAYNQAQQAQMQKQLFDMKLSIAKRTEAAEAQKRAALLSLMSQQQPTPQAPMGVSPSSAAALDAPWASRANFPQDPTGMQPGGGQIPLDKLRTDAMAGVDIGPFLKLNEAGQPKTRDIPLGNEVVTIDERTNNVVSRKPMGAAPGAKPYEAQDINSQAYRDFLLQKGAAGASKNIQNVQNFTPASEEAQKEFMKSTRVNYEAVRNAPTVLKNIEAAKALIPSAKGFMGTGGETLLETAKFLNNRLGMSISTEGIKSAEELRSRVFFQLMENLKKMDAQPSQMQQVMMRDALGKLGTDPNALGAVLDAYGDVVRDKGSIHNREVQSATQRGVKFPYDPIIELRQGGAGKVKKYNPATGRIE